MSVWKWFRFKLPITIKGIDFPIDQLDQILVHDYLLDKEQVFAGNVREYKRKEWLVYGRYYDRKDAGANNVEKFSHDYRYNKKLIFDGGFSYDQDHNLLKFSDAAFIYDSEAEAKKRFINPSCDCEQS